MIGLSNSTLEIFKSCPTCFWMDKNGGVKRPRGIFPSLPRGIDKVMKAHTESSLTTKRECIYLAGSKAVPFPDRTRLVKFQSWRTFQGVFDVGGTKVKAWGELDDLLIHPGGEVSPWDYKSKGSPPDDAVEYTEQYYQLQNDMYALLLGAQGLNVTPYGYFTYTWPVEVDWDGKIQFDHITCRVDNSVERALAVLKAATDCLAGPCPLPAPSCEWCAYVAARQQQQEAIA